MATSWSVLYDGHVMCSVLYDAYVLCRHGNRLEYQQLNLLASC